MTKLAFAVLSLLGVGAQVVPCNNAVCVGSNQQPIILGNTLQVSQGYWPDGGRALLTPVVAGASIEVLGTMSDPNDGGVNTTPGVVIGSRNTLTSTDPLFVAKNHQAVVMTGKAGGEFSAVSIDAGSALIRGDLQVLGSIIGGSASTLTPAVIDAGTGLFRADLQVVGTLFADGTFAPLSTKNVGIVHCDGGSPAWTVRSGAVCTCTDQTDNTKIPKCPVASTTATMTCTANDDVAYHCL